MKYEMVKVYQWFDLQEGMCQILGIDPETFRDQPEGDYWNVCLEHIIPEEMHNGVTVTMYHAEEYWLDDMEEWMIEEWMIPVFQAWNQLYDSLDESGTDAGIQVHFWW